MAITFNYRGLDSLGKQVRGEITAEDAQGATTLLRSRSIFPTEVTPAKTREDSPASSGKSIFSFMTGRNSAADVAILTRQLANLVSGGVPMMSAFAALTAHTENLHLRAVLETMQDEVRGGKALWEALAPHGDVFPPLYVNMVKAGEASGQLAAVLSWLADYQEKEQARRMQIRGAMAYPILLLCAGFIAIILLITLVVPKFSAMFSEFGQALPLPTQILLSTSHFMAKWGWTVIVGIALIVTGLRRYARTPAGKLRVDAWRLHIPLMGKLTIKSAMSRFARTTSTLMQGGVPLLDALSVVRDVLGNEVLAQATDNARDGMREGERFADRLQQTGVFPPFLTQMIGIGEETGDLRNMLTTVASTYDIEVDSTLKGLVSMLEPLIIITIGGLMGFIIMSMLLPIFQIDLLGG
ncbi:MAG TPA: type II secretion system F family protein [Armatimonadota bacterium]|nr:type II secretion system F family protein [Armatimonadota bacterium]